MTDYQIAKEAAETLVRAAPELTGCAKPQCWWIYLGDYCICNLNLTKEEAEHHATLLQTPVIQAFLTALKKHETLQSKDR